MKGFVSEAQALRAVVYVQEEAEAYDPPTYCLWQNKSVSLGRGLSFGDGYWFATSPSTIMDPTTVGWALKAPSRAR